MIYVPKSCQVAGGTQKRSKLGTLLDATGGGLFHLWRTASVAGTGLSSGLGLQVPQLAEGIPEWQRKTSGIKA